MGKSGKKLHVGETSPCCFGISITRSLGLVFPLNHRLGGWHNSPYRAFTSWIKNLYWESSMRKSGKFAALVGLAALWACAMDASAQSNKAVEDRQAVMKANGAAVAGITAFVKENKGTMADVERHIATLQTNSGKVANEALWPKGTSSAELGKATRAKPEIWSKWDEFKKADATFDAEVEKFAAAAKGGDKAAIEPALATLGRSTCGACHTAFRGPQS